MRPADAEQIGSKNAALLRRVATIDVSHKSLRAAVPSDVRSDLVTKMDPEMLALFADRADAPPAYVDQCRDAGVPIPPDCSDAAWKSRGALTVELISEELEPELFTYESENPKAI